MANAYQPFPITEFKTGLHNYLQSWIRPIDAFEPLVNAYVYRGTVNKRAGSSIYGNQLADTNPVMGLMQYINASTGVVSLLAGTTANLYLYDVGTNTFLTPSLATFTGNITNFFNWTNWQPTSNVGNLLYMTNNKDNITTYDGTVAATPTITVRTGVTITYALDVKVYKNRLLLIRPKLSSSSFPENQAIYWSALQNPSNFLVDVAGNGGFIEAPTSDVILSAEFLRDVLVVFFTHSTWLFRYTGNETNPFRWDKVNDSKSTNTPYASVEYDERVTSIGATGLIACDGTNVQRYDIPIIDYYESSFSEAYYAQAFSQRYDNLNQTWTLYVSSGNDFPVIGDVAPGSDQALVYNFLEKSWATYTFQVPMTCLGLFYAQSGRTWASFNVSPDNDWDNTDTAWNSYYNQSRAPILLAGDTSGNVYYMDDGDEVTDNGTSIVPTIVTTRWNPIIQAGQKVQFGYIDIYYKIVSTIATPIWVTLDFYVDNSSKSALTKTLTLDGPTNSSYAFKRIYVNLIGEFIQMEIDPNVNSFMQFVGFVLWARPAGRLTPP